MRTEQCQVVRSTLSTSQRDRTAKGIPGERAFQERRTARGKVLRPERRWAWLQLPEQGRGEEVKEPAALGLGLGGQEPPEGAAWIRPQKDQACRDGGQFSLPLWLWAGWGTGTLTLHQILSAAGLVSLTIPPHLPSLETTATVLGQMESTTGWAHHAIHSLSWDPCATPGPPLADPQGLVPGRCEPKPLSTAGRQAGLQRDLQSTPGELQPSFICLSPTSPLPGTAP